MILLSVVFGSHDEKQVCAHHMILIESGGGRERVYILYYSFFLCLLIKGEVSFCIDLSGTSDFIYVPR